MTPEPQRNQPEPGWRDGPASPATDVDLWQMLERSFGRHPDAVALFEPDTTHQVTYRDLHEMVLSQAKALTDAGVTAGSNVAIAHGRSMGEIVAVLGALRCGAAYFSVDPSAPDTRLAAILERTNPVAVIGDYPGSRRVRRLATTACASVEPVDTTSEPDQTQPPPYQPDPGRVAYLAFTSGSTGSPKGVAVPHRGITNLVAGASYFAPKPGDRCLRLAPLSFDGSTLEIFTALAAGATLVIYPNVPVAPKELADVLRSHRVTHALLTSGLFRVLVDEAVSGFETLRQVVAGGDVVPAGHCRRLRSANPGITITNAYGPTENSVVSTAFTMSGPGEIPDPLPIGSPVSGVGVLVVNDQGTPVPDGEAGELWVSGTGLALGYAADPIETAKSFTVTTATQRACYRTGDLVRVGPDGLLYFLGRNDRQVKIRGFRIELEEIEKCLRGHPLVHDAAVVVSGEGSADKRILAGVTTETRDDLVPLLREHVRNVLPEYMVPSLWAIVDRLPLTAVGKVDAAKLEAVAVNRRSVTTTPEPADDLAGVAAAVTEASGSNISLDSVIYRAWVEVLGTKEIGFHEGFFEAGGDSILAGRLHTVLSDALPGRDIRIVDVFAHPTIAGLARHLEGATR